MLDVTLAAWDMVCKPKQKGRLGVINIETQNKALLLKNLHKFYNKVDLPWVNMIWATHYDDQVPHLATSCGSFWWRDIMCLVKDFRGIAVGILGSGETLLFRKDLWNATGILGTSPMLRIKML